MTLPEQLKELVKKWRKLVCGLTHYMGDGPSLPVETYYPPDVLKCANELEALLAQLLAQPQPPALTEGQVPWRQYFILRMKGHERTAGEDSVYAQLEKQLRGAALAASTPPADTPKCPLCGLDNSDNHFIGALGQSFSHRPVTAPPSEPAPSQPPATPGKEDWGVKHGIREVPIIGVRGVIEACFPQTDEDTVFERESAIAFIKDIHDRELVKVQAEAEAKWQMYEHEYILPCFKWAEERGIDLPKLVRENAGKNCVQLLVNAVEAQGNLEQLWTVTEPGKELVERAEKILKGIALQYYRCEGDAIELAKEFAQVQAEAEARNKEALASWMIAHSYATGHGDTFEDMLGELVGQAEAREKKDAFEDVHGWVVEQKKLESISGDALLDILDREIRILLPGEPPAPSKRICGTKLNPIASTKSWICLLTEGHDGPCESNIDVVRQRSAKSGGPK